MEFAAKSEHLAKLARGCERLPRRVRRDLDVLAETARLEAHPKLARQIDRRAAERAYRRAHRWLKRNGRGARLQVAALDTAALIAFRLLLAAGLVALVLRWRGLI